MKWREKLHNMALIDLLYLMNDNLSNIQTDLNYDEYLGVCAYKAITGIDNCKYMAGESACKECLIRLLNEEVK